MLTDIVTTPPSPAFYGAMIAYAVASIFYLGSIGAQRGWMPISARLVMFAAFIFHGVDIGWRGVEHVHPGTSVHESLGFLSWIVVGACLYLERGASRIIFSVFVAPLALIVLAAARLSPSGEAMTGLNTLGRLHIASATVGVAIFCLATVVSVVYWTQERNLKRKKFDGLIFKSSAALETLDQLSSRLVSAGFPIFTLSMMLGGIWVSQLNQGYYRIEYPIAAFTWVAFGVLVLGRSLGRIQGRRAALITMLGFSLSLTVLGIYFLRRAVVG